MYEDIELNTFHDLSTTAERVLPLKIAVADAMVRHIIASLKERLCPPSLSTLGESLVFNYRSMGTLASRGRFVFRLFARTHGLRTISSLEG